MGYNRSKIGNKKYHQGHFPLQNPEKYLGDPRTLVYRSSWEFAFCRYCDLSDNIRKWSAENLEIQYQMQNDHGQTETHRYYPDFYIEMVKSGDKESYEKLLIELKPKAETEPPKKPVKQTLKMLENYEYALRTFKKNLHKWAYAKEWCDRRNLKFVIITEDDLKKRGLIPS